MEDIKLDLHKNGHGMFYVLEGTEPMGEMAVKITEPTITVYHTEVPEKAEGKGFAKKLLEYMVAYAREHKLMVIPLCPYVLAQFKRHPELYADIWKKEEVK